MDLDSEISPSDRARLFWSTQDLDSVFCEIQNQINQLQTRLQTHAASDTDLEQSLKLLEVFDWPFVTTPPVVQVVIGSDAEVAPPALAPGTAAVCEGSEAAEAAEVPEAPEASMLPVVPEVPEVPEVPMVPEYKEHFCSQSCVPTLLRMPQSRLWALNPLNVPLVYGFYRSEPELDQSERGVVYTTPCGLRLCNHDDVMDFLLMSKNSHLLQSDMFSFSSSVSVNPCGPVSEPALALGSASVDPPVASGPDLSRGQELTPVELCLTEGERPPVFKYRRDRWPHGCFLSDAPDLYRCFCDCRGRCEPSCPCVSMTTGHTYKHGRLQEPNKRGIVECGPWCGCDPGLCQNRVVQRGLRVRLQVYKTKTSPEPSLEPSAEPSPQPSPQPSPDPSLDQHKESSPDQKGDHRPDQIPERGWGVRCKDDLEQGTFICLFAGVVLQRGDGHSEAPPLKQRKAELAADDEIQLVTEWLPNTAPSTDPAHVPVIQRGSDNALTGSDNAKEQAPVNGSKRTLDQTRTNMFGSDFYLIDASKEGNVSRFFNHSCDPTLFVQNVFTDSHDQRFPHIAFFTSRALKAGTELTWDYNSAPSQEVNGAKQEVEEGEQEVNSAKQEVEQGIQEVPCLCRSVVCRQRFHVMELRNGTVS